MSVRTNAVRFLVPVLSLAALSCGSPSTPPAVGALSITVGGGDCLWPNTGTTLPAMMPPLQSATSSAQVASRESVETCAVVGAPATGFDVTGRIDTGTHVFSMTTVFGAPVTMTGGQINIRYQQQQGLPPEGIESVMPCTARALESLEGGGAIFLEFSCPALENTLTQGSTCTTTNARVLFENCSK